MVPARGKKIPLEFLPLHYKREKVPQSPPFIENYGKIIIFIPMVGGGVGAG